MRFKLSPLTLAVTMALGSVSTSVLAAEQSSDSNASVELESLTVTASADASAEGYPQRLKVAKSQKAAVPVFWALKTTLILRSALPATPMNLFRTVRHRASVMCSKPIPVSG